MKTGPRVRALHAHAWMATKLIDAQASYTRTRGLKKAKRPARVNHAYAWVLLRPGTKLAQLWHNSLENSWAYGAAHRRAHAHHAHAWMVLSGRTARTRQVRLRA